MIFNTSFSIQYVGWYLASLVRDHLLLKDFEHYEIIFKIYDLCYCPVIYRFQA
jgi:hypothetical protein